MARSFGARRWHFLAPIALAAGALAVTARPTVPAEPAATMDLGRYAGRWYVIARMPSGPPPRGAWFEFRPRANGEIEDVYAAREGSFDRDPVVVERVARADPQRPAKWEVESGWIGSDERWVLYVSPDYRYSIAGEPDLDAAWVLAREPVIPEWHYAGLLARLAMQGYDVSRFRRVAQKPEQIGRPGFE